MKREYTDTEIIFIKEMYLNHPGSWQEITDKYNKKFKKEKTIDALQKAYERWGSYYEVEEKEVGIELLRATRKQQKRNSLLTRHNNQILDQMNSVDDVVNAVKAAVNTLKVDKVQFKRPKKATDKRNMTMEMLLSDLHYGKLVEPSVGFRGFNQFIARERMQKYTGVVLREFHDHTKIFNVERIIIALIGDIIESYTMHQLESATGCEMSNSEQIQLAIVSLFHDVFVPLGRLGVRIDVPCIAGNHDRTEVNKTFNNVGKNNVTWIIYNTLQELCKVSGLKNINFYIPHGPYQVLDIYGNMCLYEHGDLFKNDKASIERHIANRSKQVGHMIDFIRLGHWHEVTMYEQGRIMINGCLTGQDSYAEHKGFNTQAHQVINFYVKPKDRPTAFYKTFPVYLK